MSEPFVGVCEICRRPQARDKAEWQNNRDSVCGRTVKWPPNAAYADCYLTGYERLSAEADGCRCLKPGAVDLALDGHSIRAAAKLLGVPKSTLYDYLRREGIVSAPAEDAP